MSPFASRSFRFLFVGQALSQVADWVKLIALLGCVYTLVPSVQVLACLFLISVSGRWLGDFWSRQVEWNSPKGMMILIGLLRGLVTLGVFSGILLSDLLLIYLFLFGSSLLSSLYDPLSSRLLSVTVPEKTMTYAASAVAVLANTAMVTGGVIVLLIGERVEDTAMLAGSACLYVLSALIIGMVRLQVIAPMAATEVAAAGNNSYGQQVRAGFALMRQQPMIRLITGLQGGLAFCFGVVITAAVIMVLTTFAGGSQGLGVAYAWLAVTYPLSTFLVNRFGRESKGTDRSGLYLIGSMLAFYVVVCLFLFLMRDWYLFLMLLFVAQLLYSGMHAMMERMLTRHLEREAQRTLSASWQLVSRLLQGAGILVCILLFS